MYVCMFRRDIYEALRLRSCDSPYHGIVQALEKFADLKVCGLLAEVADRYVCIYVCMYVCMYVCKYLVLYLSNSVYACMYVCTDEYLSDFLVCICMYMYVCMYVCILYIDRPSSHMHSVGRFW